MLFTIVFILTSPVRTQVYVFSEIIFREHGTIQNCSFINTITKETMRPYSSQLNKNVNELINIPSNPFGLIAQMYGVLSQATTLIFVKVWKLRGSGKSRYVQLQVKKLTAYTGINNIFNVIELLIGDDFAVFLEKNSMTDFSVSFQLPQFFIPLGDTNFVPTVVHQNVFTDQQVL